MIETGNLLEAYDAMQARIKKKIKALGCPLIPLTEKQWYFLYNESINPGNERDLSERYPLTKGIPDFLPPFPGMDSRNVWDWWEEQPDHRVRVTYELYASVDDILTRLRDNLWEGGATLGMYNSIYALSKRMYTVINDEGSTDEKS